MSSDRGFLLPGEALFTRNRNSPCPSPFDAIHRWSKKCPTKLNSPAALAKLKAYIEADKPKTGFAGWCSQFPGPAKLFGMIVRRWGGSTATAPGTNGKWAAYTYPEWSKIVGVPVSTLKRHLDRIEEAGLIERALHPYGGQAVKFFIRPTPLALTVTNAKHDDWNRLGLPAPTEADPKDLGALFCELYGEVTGKVPLKLAAAQRKQPREFAEGCPHKLDPQFVPAKAVSECKDFTVEVHHACDWNLYKERNLIERFFNKLKHFRCIATRYDKPLANFMGFVTLGAIHLLLR